MELQQDLSNHRYDTLVVASEDVQLDQSNSEIVYDAPDEPDRALTANVGMYDVDGAHIDQSGSTILMQGGNSKTTVMNRIEGGSDIVLTQRNTTTVVKAGPKADLTAVNYITGTDNFTQNMSNSKIVVDGRRKKGGVVAHTVVGGDANVTINISNTTMSING